MVDLRKMVLIVSKWGEASYSGKYCSSPVESG